jgi:CheY-like chemotaxis protein
VDAVPASAAKLLVVDDDEANLKTFVRVFRREYPIVSAASGDEALAVLARERVDVALVDHSMPGMSGLELLRRMRELHPLVKRVMLTAYGDLPELRAAVEAGLAITVVTKPWDRSEIVEVIAQAMRLAAGRGGAATKDGDAGLPG